MLFQEQYRDRLGASHPRLPGTAPPPALPGLGVHRDMAREGHQLPGATSTPPGIVCHWCAAPRRLSSRSWASPTALGTGQGIHVAAYFGHEGHEGQRGYRNTGNTGTSGTPGTELIQEDGGHRTRGTQGIWENGGQKSMRYRGYWHKRNGGTQEHS